MSSSQPQPIQTHTFKCTADFCLIPLGTPTASVSAQIADVQRLIKRSGVTHTMHSAGTTLEGPWTEVMNLIGACHAMLHEKGIVRIQSDIRAGSRTDKSQTARDKVEAVEMLLAQDRDEGEAQNPALSSEVKRSQDERRETIDLEREDVGNVETALKKEGV